MHQYVQSEYIRVSGHKFCFLSSLFESSLYHACLFYKFTYSLLATVMSTCYNVQWLVVGNSDLHILIRIIWMVLLLFERTSRVTPGCKEKDVYSDVSATDAAHMHLFIKWSQTWELYTNKFKFSEWYVWNGKFNVTFGGERNIFFCTHYCLTALYGQKHVPPLVRDRYAPSTKLLPFLFLMSR